MRIISLAFTTKCIRLWVLLRKTMTDYLSPSSVPVAIWEGSVFLAGQLSDLFCKTWNYVDSTDSLGITIFLTLKNNILSLFIIPKLNFIRTVFMCHMSCPIIKKKKKEKVENFLHNLIFTSLFCYGPASVKELLASEPCADIFYPIVVLLALFVFMGFRL